VRFLVEIVWYALVASLAVREGRVRSWVREWVRLTVSKGLTMRAEWLCLRSSAVPQYWEITRGVLVAMASVATLGKESKHMDGMQTTSEKW